MTRGLIVVDVQNDFCEGGSLPVAGGADVAFAISEVLRQRVEALPGQAAYDYIVATRDHHVDPGEHFSDHPNFTTSWPRHCVAGTDGAAFHPNLDPAPFDAIFDKGEYQAAYSGFEGRTHDGADLGSWLRSNGVATVDVVGIATDHCVRATALDAARQGFATTVLLGMTAGVARQSTERALVEMRAAGVQLDGQPVVRAN